MVPSSFLGGCIVGLIGYAPSYFLLLSRDSVLSDTSEQPSQVVRRLLCTA